MIESKTSVTLSLKDAKQIIDHLHDSCQVSVTFCTDDVMSGKILLRACSIIGSTTDEQLDAEEKSELKSFMESHPDLEAVLHSSVENAILRKSKRTVKDDEDDDLETPPMSLKEFVNELPGDDDYDALDNFDVASYKASHPEFIADSISACAPGLPGGKGRGKVEVVDGKYCLM